MAAHFPHAVATAENAEDRWRAGAIFALGVVVSAMHLWFSFGGTFPMLTMTTLHFAGIGALCALIAPSLSGGGRKRRRRALVIDAATALLVVAVALFVLFAEESVAARGYSLAPWDWAAGLLAIGLGLELSRRTTGFILPALSLLAFTYVTLWGAWIGGIFFFPGLSWESALSRSIYTDEGMFGVIANISVTVVALFVLLGAFLEVSGASKAVIDIARALMGRITGGPGFVAVAASGMMGTISGSAAANTAGTGVMTIPMMKRAGFSPKFAAGVEAASSTGGQLMPPIMGAGVFVMASITGIPYLDIIAVAALPALLYFLSVAFWVRIEAKKQGVGAGAGDPPKIIATLREGGITFVIAIGVLVGLLVAGFTPGFAAPFAILTVVLASWLTPNRMGWRAVLEALALGARNVVLVGMLLVIVGLIVNALATAGVGPTLSQMMKEWAGGSLIIALTLVALASLVLGMGLPVTAAYIVLATISAPALYDLIIASDIQALLASGAAPDGAKALLMLAAPESAAAVRAPMSLEDAGALIANLPRDIAPAFAQAMADGLTPAALVTALLSAHMIIFWLSQDSNVTPPVCLTAFIAASIAGSRPMATGMTAWRIAKGLYIVPVLFAYTPFLSGDPLDAVTIFAFGLVGIYALTAAFEGYAEAPIPLWLRPLLAAAGIAALWPSSLMIHLTGVSATAVIVLGTLALYQRRLSRLLKKADDAGRATFSKSSHQDF